MGSILDKLKVTNGKKTYGLIIATIGYAVSAAVVGEMEVSTAVSYVIGSLFAGTLRHGMSTTIAGLIENVLQAVLTEGKATLRTKIDPQGVNR